MAIFLKLFAFVQKCKRVFIKNVTNAAELCQKLFKSLSKSPFKRAKFRFWAETLEFQKFTKVLKERFFAERNWFYSQILKWFSFSKGSIFEFRNFKTIPVPRIVHMAFHLFDLVILQIHPIIKSNEWKGHWYRVLQKSWQ